MLLLADKPQLVKIVGAWGSIRVGPKKKLGEPPDGSARAVWDWPWESADYSVEDLMQKSGVSTYGFDKKSLPRPSEGDSAFVGRNRISEKAVTPSPPKTSLTLSGKSRILLLHRIC